MGTFIETAGKLIQDGCRQALEHKGGPCSSQFSLKVVHFNLNNNLELSSGELRYSREHPSLFSLGIRRQQKKSSPHFFIIIQTSFARKFFLICMESATLAFGG